MQLVHISTSFVPCPPSRECKSVHLTADAPGHHFVVISSTRTTSDSLSTQMRINRSAELRSAAFAVLSVLLSVDNVTKTRWARHTTTCISHGLGRCEMQIGFHILDACSGRVACPFRPRLIHTCVVAMSSVDRDVKHLRDRSDNYK